MAKHKVEGMSIIDMWHPKLGALEAAGALGADAWKASAGHCFGADSHQVIWYASDQEMRDNALKAKKAAAQ